MALCRVTGLAVRTGILAWLVAAVFMGCHSNGRSFEEDLAAGDLFLTAFQEGRYAESLKAVEDALKDDPENGVQLQYRGACYSMLERHEEAVESFRLGKAYAPDGFTDKTLLYLRALSLFNVKAFRRSQQILDKLARVFPHSRLSKRGQQLALKIEQRLAEGVSEGALNWYLSKGLDAYDSERPALAAEYLGEYFLLAGSLGKSEYTENPEANFSLGGAYIELGDIAGALEYLQRVPVSYGEFSGGIMHAMALKAAGDDGRARELLEEVVRTAGDQAIRERAERLLNEWTSK